MLLTRRHPFWLSSSLPLPIMAWRLPTSRSIACDWSGPAACPRMVATWVYKVVSHFFCHFIHCHTIRLCNSLLRMADRPSPPCTHLPLILHTPATHLTHPATHLTHTGVNLTQKLSRRPYTHLARGLPDGGMGFPPCTGRAFPPPATSDAATNATFMAGWRAKYHIRNSVYISRLQNQCKVVSGNGKHVP